MYKVGKRSFKCNFKSFHNSSENFSSGLPLKLLLCNRSHQRSHLQLKHHRDQTALKIEIMVRD